MTDIPPKKILRSDDKLFLIGNKSHQIVGAKLPSNRQVLQVFCYNRSNGFNIADSSTLVIEEVLIFWQKARIPTSAKWYCAQKLTNFFEKWKSLKKSSKRRTETQKANEEKFTDTLDDLFDIAADENSEAMKKVTKEEKEFLISQRKKGREGCLTGVDVEGQAKEDKKQERIEAEERRRKKAEAEKQTYATVSYDYGHDADDDDDAPDDNNREEEYVPRPSKKAEKNKKNIFTDRLIGALDKCKLSDRDGIHVISAVLKELNSNIHDYVMNHSSLGIYRSKYREAIAIEFLENVKVFRITHTKFQIYWIYDLLMTALFDYFSSFWWKRDLCFTLTEK